MKAQAVLVVAVASVLVAVAPVLVAADASAQTRYRLLDGELVDEASGAAEALGGFFDGTRVDHGPATPPPVIDGAVARPLDLTSIRIDDFALQAGDQLFEPGGPLSFEGLPPLLSVYLADQIQLAGDRVALALLALGTEVVSVSDDEVTLRSRSFESRSGRAAGAPGPSGLPRRLEIEGTLNEIDQTFQILRDGCTVPLPVPLPIGGPPPPGVLPPIEGTLGAGGDVTLIAIEPPRLPAPVVDLDAGGSLEIRGPAPGGRTLSLPRREAGLEASTAVVPSSAPAPVTSGADRPVAREISGEFTILNADTGSLFQGVEPAAPTLGELGITAPAGADVVFAGGVLGVETGGDLLVEGGRIDLPGLNAVSLSAAGDVIVTGLLELPAGVILAIRAGGVVDVQGEIVADALSIVDAEPEPIVAPAPATVCLGITGLVLTALDERPVATFSWVASTAHPMEIDVMPWRRSNRIDPARRQLLPVALLADDDLDAVVPESLRLGDGEAEPLGRRGRPWVLRVDANRDGRRDLLAFFDSSEAGIAYGDEYLCLRAETVDGELLEGCDVIDTRPRRWGRRLLRGLLGRR